MKRSMRALVAGLSTGLGLGGAIAPGLAASPDTGAFQGAFLEQSFTCKEVFDAKGKSLAFKAASNAFTPAFIISGKRLTTPLATCSIKSVTPSGERHLMTLNCANAVSTGERTAILNPMPDGSIRRYLNDDDKAGSTYRRCTVEDIQDNRGGSR